MKKLKLKNSFVVLLLVLSASLTVNALSVEKLFVEIPNKLIPTLNRQIRFEMVEYFKANGTDSIDNIFRNKSYMLRLDTTLQHIVVKTTHQSFFEMKVLTEPETENTVIAVINTVCAPICHSNIRFFTPDWQPLDITFVAPQILNWLQRDKLADSAYTGPQIEAMLGMEFVKLSFSNDNHSLEAHLTSTQLLNNEQKKIIEPLLSNDPIIFEFSDNVFKMRE